jgi:hypothetical protein
MCALRGLDGGILGASYTELLPHTLRHGSTPATPAGPREGGQGGGRGGGEIVEGKLLLTTGLTQGKLLRMVLEHMFNLTLNLKLRLWSLLSSPFVWCHLSYLNPKP